MKTRSGRRFGPFARASLALPFAGLLACNAILGAGDYHVGKGNDADAGDDKASGGASGDDDAGATGGINGAGGQPSSGGAATGSGGKTSGSGGKASGSGGRGASGGAAGMGTGGRNTSGAGGAAAAGGKSGAGGSAGALTAADFVGEWDTATETVVTDCGDGSPTTDTTEDSLDWTLGAGNTIQVLFLGVCTLEATVSGRAATISPPQTCTDSGITYIVSGSFTIQSDGIASLNEQVTITTGGAVCNSKGTGSYTKYKAP